MHKFTNLASILIAFDSDSVRKYAICGKESEINDAMFFNNCDRYVAWKITYVERHRNLASMLTSEETDYVLSGEGNAEWVIEKNDNPHFTFACKVTRKASESDFDCFIANLENLQMPDGTKVFTSDFARHFEDVSYYIHRMCEDGLTLTYMKRAQNNDEAHSFINEALVGPFWKAVHMASAEYED